MAVAVVHDYMKKWNRPFNVNDVVTNLHSDYGKAAIQKAMDQLEKDGKLFSKVYGKQKIYCIVQDSTTDVTELMRIDKELQTHAREVEAEYQKVIKNIKTSESLLASLKSSLSLEEAKREKITLQESISQLTCKLDQLKKICGSGNLHVRTKKEAQKELDENLREYQKRKRICTEIIDCILENYPGSKNDLYDEIGIDPTTVK